MQKPAANLAQPPHMRRYQALFSRNLVFNASRSNHISGSPFSPSFPTFKRRPPPRLIASPRSSCKCYYKVESAGDDHMRRNLWSGSNAWTNEFVPASEDSDRDDKSPRISDSPSIPVQKLQRVKKREGELPSSGERNPRTGNGGGSDSSAQWSGVKKKAGKSKIHWVCESCGESFAQWWGSCRHCGGTNTLKQFVETDRANSKVRGSDVSEKIARSWLAQQPGSMRPQRLSEVNKGHNQSEWRIPLSGFFGAEVSRVLGGGLVPGSLILVGGDPGVGKSTLLLQIAAILAEESRFDEPAPVIYVSGEESVEQIGNRADRMRICTDELFLYSSTDVEDILEKTLVLSPRALIVDSIQTVYLKDVPGSAGSVAQIGHVTKTGDIAGPRVLEHIVDAVLYMEGESYSSHRLLRSVKNRFGSTDELGVFEMSQCGLQAASNPSEIFLSGNYSSLELLAGVAIAVVLDGSRTFLIEIQALCSSSPTVARHYNGVAANRADMIISVLSKQAGLKLQDNAIFLNVVSGFKLTETAGDLAIAAAICSSFLEFPIPNDVAFIGEVGLGGELRMVPRLDRRINAISKLGYKKCIIPKAAENSLRALKLEGLETIGCWNLKDVINTVFVC